MSPGFTMERVYDALRHQILQGDRLPGTRLDPARLSADLNSSATPIRDALHRLSGEGLVEAWPQDGFHVPIRSEAGLRDLYGWSLDILLAATRPSIPSIYGGEPEPDLSPSDDHAECVDALFAAIAAISGNLQHREAMESVNARLHPFRRIEPHLILDSEDEIDRIECAWRKGEGATLKRRLTAYHKRRVRLVPNLAAVMQARMRG